MAGMQVLDFRVRREVWDCTHVTDDTDFTALKLVVDDTTNANRTLTPVTGLKALFALNYLNQASDVKLPYIQREINLIDTFVSESMHAKYKKDFHENSQLRRRERDVLERIHLEAVTHDKVMTNAIAEIDRDMTMAAALGSARQRFCCRKPNMTEYPLKSLVQFLMMIRPDEGHAGMKQFYGNNPMVFKLLQRIKTSRRELYALVESRATNESFNRYFDEDTRYLLRDRASGFYINPLYIRERSFARAAKDTAVIEHLNKMFYSRNSSFGDDSFLVAMSFQETYVSALRVLFHPTIANEDQPLRLGPLPLRVKASDYYCFGVEGNAEDEPRIRKVRERFSGRDDRRRRASWSEIGNVQNNVFNMFLEANCAPMAYKFFAPIYTCYHNMEGSYQKYTRDLAKQMKRDFEQQRECTANRLKRKAEKPEADTLEPPLKRCNIIV